MEAVTGAIWRVKLGKHSSVRGGLSQISDPNFGGLDVGCVQYKLLVKFKDNRFNKCIVVEDKISQSSMPASM